MSKSEEESSPVETPADTGENSVSAPQDLVSNASMFDTVDSNFFFVLNSKQNLRRGRQSLIAKMNLRRKRYFCLITMNC